MTLGLHLPAPAGRRPAPGPRPAWSSRQRRASAAGEKGPGPRAAGCAAEPDRGGADRVVCSRSAGCAVRQIIAARLGAVPAQRDVPLKLSRIEVDLGSVPSAAGCVGDRRSRRVLPGVRSLRRRTKSRAARRFAVSPCAAGCTVGAVVASPGVEVRFPRSGICRTSVGPLPSSPGPFPALRDVPQRHADTTYGTVSDPAQRDVPTNAYGLSRETMSSPPHNGHVPRR